MILDFLQAQKACPGIVCGQTRARQPGTWFGKYHDASGTLNGRRFSDHTVLYGCTCNLSIDTSKLDIEFDESFKTSAFEDVDFCLRSRQMGVKITFEAQAVVWHSYGEESLFAFFERFRKYGTYESLVHRKHPWYPDLARSSYAMSSKGVLTDRVLMY